MIEARITALSSCRTFSVKVHVVRPQLYRRSTQFSSTKSILPMYFDAVTVRSGPVPVEAPRVIQLCHSRRMNLLFNLSKKLSSLHFVFPLTKRPQSVRCQRRPDWSLRATR